MFQRIVSAFIALLVFVPIFILGGPIFNIAILVIAILGLKELLDAKRHQKEFPMFIEFITYVLLSLFILVNMTKSSLVFEIDYRYIVGLFLAFTVPVVLYQDRAKYSIVDSLYLIGAVFFLGVSFSLMILLRNINLETIIYLFLITMITDTYAYLIGSLIGRHKLAEKTSPNKSWEGTIFGSIVGTFIGTLFYINFVNSSVELTTVIFMTLFLSVIGQFGDLYFSSIKRYYKIKDFSNIMPGHGGILDRCDSIIFVILGYMFFISII